MKLNQLIIATVGFVDAFNPVEDGERRYKESEKILNFYIDNDDFSMKNITSYGCNCFAVGDRPLSGSTIRGPPVDALDQMCKDYKDCLECAKKTHGDGCIPEFIEGSPKAKYIVRYGPASDENNVVCKNEPGTCKRDLCECAKKLGKQMGSKPFSDLYDETKSSFYGNFDQEAECATDPTGRASARTPKCCQDYDKEGPFRNFGFDLCHSNLYLKYFKFRGGK